MRDLIDREHVIDFLKLTRDSEYEKSMSAEVKHKSVIRSKHDAHVAFCDYLIEYVNQVPTHPTPSNTLGALDCIDRQEAIKALCREECGMDPKGCRVGTCYDVEIIEDVPSVQPELSNNSKELDNENGELISRQDAIDAIDRERKTKHLFNTAEDGLLEARRVINTLPSPRPRKGKWTRREDRMLPIICECSVCGFDTTNFELFSFCPNCGCRMEEGDSDDL